MRTIATLVGSKGFAVLTGVLAMGFLLGASVIQASPKLLPTQRAERHSAALEYYHSGADLKPYVPAAISQNAFLSSSLIEDLRVSESIAPGRFMQSDPSVCALSDGSIVVAWVDEREGASKVYLQKFDANGVAIGSNVKAAERTDGEGLFEPKVASTISGKFYLAFRDAAAGEIRALRYNSDLSVDLAEFVVSDAGASGYAGLFDIAARFTGELVVAYESYTAINEIHVRRFLADGSINGGLTAANQVSTAVARWAPSVTYDDDGGYAISWEDYSTGVADIHFRRFDSLAEAISDEINLIDASAQSSGQYLPSLVFSPIHGFVTGFTDTRSGWKVYLQRYSKQIGLVGTNLWVSPADSAVYSDPALTVSPSGLLTALYCKYAFSSSALAQRFDASLAFIGSAKTLNQLSDGGLFEPAIATAPSGNHSFGWTVSLSGDKDVRLFVTDPSFNSLTPAEVKVNSDPLGAVSDQARISLMQGKRILTVFRDQRFDEGDVFLQTSLLDGTLDGGNVKVNQDDPGGVQSAPAVASNDATMLVAWLDERKIAGVDGSRVFARYGAFPGFLNGPEIQISGDNTEPKAAPQVAISGESRALVVWLDYRNGRAQVFGRLLDEGRGFVGNEFAISSISDDRNVSELSISVDSANRFHVFWLDLDPSGTEIKSKMYNAFGGAVGGATFLSDQPGVSISDFDATADLDGNQYLVWIGAGVSTSALYLSSQSEIGVTIAATVEVTDNLGAEPISPSVSVDDADNVLLAWIDSRGPERRIYTQVFGAGGVPQGANQPLSLAAAPVMYDPDAVAVRGRSWVAWADARSEGMNVYLNSFVHFQTDVVDEDDPALPEGFTLSQNYPNPFNPRTNISYTLPRASFVTLSIFDITGRKVRTLLTDDRPAGSHTSVWDGLDENGSHVASGVYLYRLRAGELVASRKMTLLK